MTGPASAMIPVLLTVTAPPTSLIPVIVSVLMVLVRLTAPLVVFVALKLLTALKLIGSDTPVAARATNVDTVIAEP